MSGQSVAPPHVHAGASQPAGGYQLYRGADCWPGAQEMGLQQQDDPALALWVPGSYACLYDLYRPTGQCEAMERQYPPDGMRMWLLIGAAKVNEHLGNRGWPVPLTKWSATVVWANCELAYLMATRSKGLNMEGSQFSNIRDREEAVKTWLTSAQDREITPDVRLSKEQAGKQAMAYIGQPRRGWDGPPGGGWGRR